MASRIRHNSLACAPLSAITPSATSPSSNAVSSNLSSRARIPLSVWLDDISRSTYHGWRAARGSVSGDMGQRQIEPGARDQFECRQLVGGDGTGASEQAHRVFDPAKAEERGFDLARLGKEF